MLLAPKLGAPPREIAERLGEALQRAARRARRARRGRRARVPERLPVRRLVHGRGRRTCWRPATTGARGTAAERERIVDRVRLRQPDRPDHRGQRPPRRLRRRAGAAARVRRPRRVARVLLQRRRRAADPARRVDPRARPRRGGARGRLPGRVRGRAGGPRSTNAAERDAEDLAFAGGQLMIERIKDDARALRRPRSTPGSPSARCTTAAIERALERVEKAGHAYRSEGALWLRTTDFGDDQDRVIVRSTGAPTYFAADLAYLENKVERGFERLITPLGADHHGYVPRFKAALAVLGGDPDKLEIPLLQFVHIVERGERASMSKRRGEFVTLDELVDQIGVDATRYFLLQRSHDSTIDLDLELATRGVGREPRLLRPVRARADRLDPAQGRARAGRRRRSRLHPVRARADQEAARLPGRGRGGGRAPGAAPDRRLRARAGPDLHGVLPRLPGGRRRAGARRVVQARPVRGRRQRTLARSLGLLGRLGARRQSDVGRATARLKKFSPRLSSACWASMLSVVSSPVNSRMPMAISTAPDSAGDDQVAVAQPAERGGGAGEGDGGEQERDGEAGASRRAAGRRPRRPCPAPRRR